MSAHPRPALPPGPFLVLGLARSGAAAALALRARGEEVIGADAGAPEGLQRLIEAGVEVHPGTQANDLVAGARTLVKSPGVPREAPAVAAAHERGLALIGELELAWRLIPNDFIAVTGTNGKTTTTEWIGHIYREAGLPVAVAGNVGTAASSLVEALAPEAAVVCEASSFQLEDTVAFAPDAAVLLNIAPDHLDRHGSLDDYRRAKLEIFRRQGNDDVAVAPLHLDVEDLGGCARRVLFGDTPGAALEHRAGWLWWDEQPLIDASQLALRGDHNRSNAMAAAAITLARGVDPDAVRAGLRSFPGVAHRLEEVVRRDGVLYVNDSKATNVAAAVVALRSFDGGVHAIFGGRGKGEDYAPLARPVGERCAAVYVIGDDGPAIGAALSAAGVDVALAHCGDLERAVAAARAAARPGETILLAPACASQDQFRDFEQRGEAFRALAQGA